MGEDDMAWGNTLAHKWPCAFGPDGCDLTGDAIVRCQVCERPVCDFHGEYADDEAHRDGDWRCPDHREARPVVIGPPRQWTWHGDAPEPGDLFMTAHGTVRMVTAYHRPVQERFQNDIHGRTRHRIEVVRVDPATVDIDACELATLCKPDGTPR